MSDHNTKSILSELGYTFNSKIKLSQLIFLFLSKKLGTSILGNKYLGRKKYGSDKIQHYKCLMGYFQNNHDISLEFVNDLRKRLAKIEKSDLTGIESVVHFRGGDFNATNDVILEKYYTKSLKDFKKVLIITNDKNRAHNFFSKNCPWLSFEFTIGKSLLEEFRILTDARHITGSNSTFCWWAAELSDAVIVQPKEFYDFTWKPNSRKKE